MAKARMNVKLLRRIQKQILEEPKRFDMFAVVAERDCGTVACIGGWANLLSGHPFADLTVAKTVLRLTGKWNVDSSGLKSQQHGRLFFIEAWPIDLRRRYTAATTPEQGAQVAFERIDLFIDTKGAE